MFTDRRDYLIDMIQQVMERVVALLQKSRGHPVELAELERDCERAMDDEFAELHRRMQGVEPRMVGHLVRPVERLRAYALLLAAQALLQSRQAAAATEATEDPGEPSPAAPVPAEVEAAARRALSLVLEASLASEPTPPILDAVRALYPLVDDEQLTPRYLEAIVDLSPVGCHFHDEDDP